ncbi:proton-conducting transporter membrane subunit [Kitasatospora sp. NPDC005856]|uniref:proton-conducting transporter transmembrane domain-containing protein n=1 Tax=Kitasatospora sp. NPDC005856 TaxID=3154566 RepID=UPI0033C0477F
MNAIAPALAAASGLAAAGSAAGLVSPERLRPALVGVCTAGVGAAGLAAGGAALGGQRWSASLPDLLPLAGVHLALDALSGLFTAVSGGVIVVAAVYGIGYSRQGPAGRGVQAVLPLFAWTLVMVPAGAAVSTFLLLWELMAASSLLLVVAEHRKRAAVREAGVWYAVMTHLGLVCLLIALVLFAARAGGETFPALRAASDTLSPAVRGTVFVLALAGFGSKADMVPLHAWLPRAYPEAPSHVSALMSAAMANLGAYGLIRTAFDLLGGGPRWWGLLAVALGAVTAVYGIVQAAVATDLKCLLAYSTSENLGLVLIGIGAALLFDAGGNCALAALALVAALLHVVNHAAFKALLFGAAGSVVRATGTRDLDALGGLRPRMPVTTALFAVGALGAIALPPGNGFISEWLLLQSLIHGLAAPGVATAVMLPVAIAAIALSAGLAAAAFVKALGVGFFARPRSAAAARAHESPPTMLAGAGLSAAACVALALVPGVLADGLGRAAAAAGLRGAGPTGGAGAAGGGPIGGGELRLRLTELSGRLAPLWIAAALVAAVAAVLLLVRALARGPRRTGAPLWACGAGAPTARMEYTATSFAEPLQRVFDDVLAPEQDVDVTPVRESAYLVERVRYQHRVPDRIEHRLYQPLLRLLARAGRAGRRLADGSVHRYLGYGFTTLVAVLLALVVTR